jgi:hypothetical protein
MELRILVTAICAVLLAMGGCRPGGESTAEDTPPAPIAGMYDVAGTTIDTAAGSRRKISGTVILAADDGHYTATFHLDTEFPSGAGVLPAEVIGKGDGTIEGRTLRGTAATQIVVTTVPGIDPAFAFIPRTTTTRIQSDSIATIGVDGSATIEIKNSPLAGESYSPTRTTLRGKRVGDAIAAAGRPAVPTRP